MKRYCIPAIVAALGGLLLIAGAPTMPTSGESAASSGFEGVYVPLAPVAIGAAFSSADGEVTGATIFGRDDRIPITNTSELPWRTVAQLVMFDAANQITGTCSGTMLNTNVVLTAAHCLYDAAAGGYIGGLLVVPGEDGPAFPFGSRVATGAGLVVPQGWAATGDLRYDFGLAYLGGTGFGPALGPFLPVGSVPDAYFYDPGTVIATAGYPGDKPAGTMWFTAGFFYFVDADAIYTEMDAYPGQSGSPIYALNDARREVLVVGVFSMESFRSNYAVRFTAGHIAALKDYCASLGCTIQTSVQTGGPGPTPTRTATSSPSPTRSPTPAPTSTRPPSPTPAPSPTRGFRAVVPQVAHDR